MAKLVRQQTATLLSSVRVRLEPPFYAQVAKLVDALDLGSSAARRGGSSPFART